MAVPGGWTELFDGATLDGWQADGPHAWLTCGAVELDGADPRRFVTAPGDGVLVNGPDGRTADFRTVAEHASCELHVEFCIAAKSNSGVYLMGQYEIQILDSAGVPDAELTDHSSGSIYPRWVAETRSSYEGHAPRTNASLPPGEWQSFEIEFRAPVFDERGAKVSNARIERLLHNGTLIHEDVELFGPTRGALSEVDVPRGPLRLQGDHGPVAFRNLRLRPLD